MAFLGGRRLTIGIGRCRHGPTAHSSNIERADFCPESPGSSPCHLSELALAIAIRLYRRLPDIEAQAWETGMLYQDTRSEKEDWLQQVAGEIEQAVRDDGENL